MADMSLKICKYVQAILEQNEEVKAIVGSDTHKIFPLLQPDNLNFPFVVHSRVGITVQYTKDLGVRFGWTNTVQFSVACVSNKFAECIELANAVRHALEGYRWYDDEIRIDPIELFTATEYTTDENAFVEELTFQCTIQ